MDASVPPEPLTPSPAKGAEYDDPNYDYAEYWVGRDYEHAAEVMAVNRLIAGKHFRRAVDVGGGYGRLSVLLKRYTDTVTLADPSRHQLQRAEHYLEEHPDIERRLTAADDLPFPDGTVDLVTLIRVMHHLADPSGELREIARVLAPGGYAIIEVANYLHARNRARHWLHLRKMPMGPVDIRSEHNKRDEDIEFVNHDPRTVIRQLEQVGLEVVRTLSVSNLRSHRLKKVLTTDVMLAVEGVLQPTLARAYFGPSIFFLVRKDVGRRPAAPLAALP
jgi:ubiquinone/menaquinone biosynthesis C-methylase UbiE